MVKTRNLREKRNPSRRREEEEENPAAEQIPPPEQMPPPEPQHYSPPAPSPQPRQTTESAQFPETREGEFAEAMQPQGFFFDHKEYMKKCKFQTKCDQYRVVAFLKRLLGGDDLRWFTEHPQFKHLFHMVGEQYRKMMGMWTLLLRTAKTDKKNQIWFVVNGVPIRYSIREHALLSGLYCDYYPIAYEKKGSMEFVKRHFGRTKVEVKDVLDKLEDMVNDGDKLKMAVLYFLSTVIYGRAKMIGGYIDEFILRVVDDLEFCKTFPWGRFTFDDCVKEVEHVMNRFNGEVQVSWTFPGFILPLETAFRVPVRNADTSCPKMCKGRYKETSYRGYRLKDIYEKLGDTKEIHSIVPVEDSEERLMMRCLGALWYDGDLTDQADGIDAIVDEWNQILVNLPKKIFWEDLYNKDCQSRVSQAAPETTAPQPAPETAQQSVPEATSMPGGQPNEDLQTVLRELAQVKEELSLVKNRLKKLEDLEEQRREGGNFREDFDYQFSPPTRVWFETGGTSGEGLFETGGTSGQGVYETGGPSAAEGVHETGGPSAAAKGVHETGGPSAAAEGVHEMGGTEDLHETGGPSAAEEVHEGRGSDDFYRDMCIPIVRRPVQPRPPGATPRYKMCARKSVRPPSAIKKRTRNPSHYQKTPYTAEGKKKKGKK